MYRKHFKKNKDKELLNKKKLTKNQCSLIIWAVIISFSLGIAGSLFFWLAAGKNTANGIEYRYFARQLDCGTVLIGNTEVRDIVEPVAEIETLDQAKILLHDLRERDARRNKNESKVKMHASRIHVGYSQWTASSYEGKHNFTFAAATQLMASISSQQSKDCVCFTEIGVAINGLYLSSLKSLIFEPSVAGETKSYRESQLQTVSSVAMLLAEAAAAENAAGPKGQDRFEMIGKPLKLKQTGTVNYISTSGVPRRVSLAETEYRCLCQCLATTGDL